MTMLENSVDTTAQAFHAAREAYRDARNSQRLLIVQALKLAGFTVKTGGNAGRGLTNYTSGRRLRPSFDLSNWMWIEAQRNDVFVMVSLQVLDQDPNSLNIHALIDRVGVEVFRTDDPVDESDALAENATTGFVLPLDAADIAALIALVEEKVSSLDEKAQ